MIISFYDKNFKTVDNNSSLNIEKFKLSRRSYDLNTFTCTCEPIELSAEPMFAIIKTDQGKHYYDCLAPVFTLDKKGTGSVIARDLKAVFNTEAIIDFTQKQTTVNNLIQYIFSVWQRIPIFKSEFNTSITIENIDGTVYQPSEKKAYNVLNLFKQICSFYELYIDSTIDLKTKTLKFNFKRKKKDIRILKLEDFGINNFAKTTPSINMAVATDNAFATEKKYYLLQSGEITENPLLQDIYPTSTKYFVAENLTDAQVDAILTLAENRNQESIKISFTPEKHYYNSIDFDIGFDVYYKGRKYKTLAIGSIDESENIEKIVTLGYKPVDLVQII